MLKSAYWISKDGKVLPVDAGLHIDSVVKYPHKFGLSDEEIKSIYDKHGEKVGQEGKAREEIIKGLVRDGFIRIRLYPNRFWSVTVPNLRRSRKKLEKWAEEMLDTPRIDKFMPVYIVDLMTGMTNKDFTLNDIYYGKLDEGKDDSEEDVVLEWVKSAEDFTDIESLSFSQYIQSVR